MSSFFTIKADPLTKSLDSSLIDLKDPSIELFSDVAKSIAEELRTPIIIESRWNKKRQSNENREKVLVSANKSTQLRKFYNEIVMWTEKVQQQEHKFSEYLPFIKMLNAKVAYANGREHVDDKFVLLVSACLDQITGDTKDDLKVLINMKLLFESVLGFHKALEK